MSRVRFTLLTVPLLLLCGGHACIPGQDDCRRSRTCFPDGGTAAIAENGAGSATGGGPTGGAASEGGLGGMGGGGGAEPEPEAELPTEGTECSPNGLYACAGHATDLQLVCAAGAFEKYDNCPAGQLCDTRAETSGLCQPVVPECSGRLPGDIVCRGTQRLICGADLITTSELDTCPSACFDGKCTECLPDTPAACEFNTRRSCTSEGAWDVTPCPTGAPHCSDGSCGQPPSCLNLDPICGSAGDESCCASPVVPSGPFGGSPNAWTMPAFRLDRFEVTVSRFRAFRAAWDVGWRPAEGSGKHVHWNDGLGLPSAPAIGYEHGWQASYLEDTNPSEETQLPIFPNASPYATWSETTGDDELRPINFVNFFEAVAFCIWDGAFLPTSSDRGYVARGGSAMRPYPWGTTEPGPDFDLAVYGCYFPDGGSCDGPESIAPVGTAAGESLFGQLDLAGNLAEWALPTAPGCDPQDPSRHCVNWPTPPVVGGATPAPIYGGAFDGDASSLANNVAGTALSYSTREPHIGFRCARVP